MNKKNIRKLLLSTLLLTLCFTFMKEPIIQENLATDTPEQILPYSDFDDERNKDDV